MNAPRELSAFAVQLAQFQGVTAARHQVNWLESVPRLPVDLALIVMCIREKFGWTTLAINGRRLGSINDNSDNAVEVALIAREGVICASVDVLGLSTDIEIQSADGTTMDETELRTMLESSRPFMLPINEEGWVAPGADHPFMVSAPEDEKSRPAPAPRNEDGKIPVPGVPMRMGQEVLAELYECAQMPNPTDVEGALKDVLECARSTRVSIMGLSATMAPDGFFKLHVSLDISESNIKIDYYFREKIRHILATLFTCGKTNPAPIVEGLHRRYDAAVTYVEGQVRGKNKDEVYHGQIDRGGEKIVWNEEPVLPEEMEDETDSVELEAVAA